MRSKYLIIIFLICAGLFAGCDDFEAPEFNRITSLKVHELTGEFVFLRGEALFNNPSKQGYKVKNIDLDVIYNKVIVATVNSTNVSRIPATAEFVIPFSVKLPVEALRNNVLSDIMAMIRGKAFDLHFQGNLKFSKFGISKKVPVDHVASIKLKF